MTRQLLSGWRTAAVAATLALLSSCGGGDETAGRPASADPSSPAALDVNGVDERRQAQAIAAPSGARWSAPITLGIVPAAAANLPNGKVMLWSSYAPLTFGATGQTYTVLFDPATSQATQTIVSNTGHDMFCPGTTNLADGRLLVNGGDDAAKTSLYDPVTNLWSTGAVMTVGRGYQSNCLLQDGSVLTYGGSWSGGRGRKGAELWTQAAGWRALPNIPIGPAIGPDPGGIYRGDNHAWLFPAPNGQVFHAGPSATMNWIDTQGNGQLVPAGRRADDSYSQNGNAVMYDIGKLLTAGGSTAYENAAASSSAFAIDLNGAGTARRVASMAYPRVFASGVALPNGQVLVVGGQVYGRIFLDDGSVLAPELWDPATERFTTLPPMSVGRNYHSFAMLLPDARVLVGGGGLCGDGCAANHPDVQVLTPHYLIDQSGTLASRPVISAAPGTVNHGTSMTVTTSRAVTSFALVRMGSVTHTVNNDQRRIPLVFTTTGTNQYSLAVPSNPSVALPGFYMLFAMDSTGVPSVSKIVKVIGTAAPKLANPGFQAGTRGTALRVPLNATASSGTLSFTASGLPPGVSIAASTGVVSGTPSASGTYQAVVTARDAAAATSTQFQVVVSEPGTQRTRRYVKLEALSAWAGAPLSSLAEFNLLDANGVALPRAGWSIVADSEDEWGTSDAGRAIDGKADTYWLSQANPTLALPHSLVVDLGTPTALTGFKMLPRSGSTTGAIGDWRLHTSPDGVNWSVVATGTFANTSTEKTVWLDGVVVPNNQPPIIGTIANRSNVSGQTVDLTVQASDADNDTLTYAASGLPAGVTINAASGAMAGTLSQAGNFTVTVTVTDGRGGVARQVFMWAVAAGGSTGAVQYVRLEAVSEISGGPWTSMAEFNVLDATGTPIPRTGWRASADSSETTRETATPDRAIDGDPTSIWHTQWSGSSTPLLPHTFTVDMGAARTVGGFRYLPRPGAGAGTIIGWRFYTSTNGVTWTLVGQDSFTGTAGEKTAYVNGGGSVPAGNRAPSIPAIADRTDLVGSSLSLTSGASDPDGDALSFSASGLPPGMQINAGTGAIAGTLTTAGSFTPTVTASDGKGGIASRSFAWSVASGSGGATPRYVRLEAVSEINGNPWTSMAEFNVLDSSGASLSRAGWVATADSSETVGETATPDRVLDGDPATIWHTRWSGGENPPPPHTLTVNMGAARTVAGFKYRPRPGGGNGTIAAWRFYTSADGAAWSLVGQGTFAASEAEKTVMLTSGGGTTPPANRVPVLAAIADRTDTVGTSVSLALAALASDADGDTLGYAASGLPAGVSINAASGLISGVPSTAGSVPVTVQVSDGKGGVATRGFNWIIVPAGTSPSGTVRYVRLDALSEINGNPWSSMAEFNLLDGSGNVLSRAGWTVSADSAETVGESGGVANAIDGDPATMWHTQWLGGSPLPPHSFTVDLGTARTIGGFRYLPRPGAGNGTIANWRLMTSSDRVGWTQVGQGTFAATEAEKRVYPLAATTANRPPTLAAIADLAARVGQAVSITPSAVDADGDALSFSASGLPAGLSISAVTGTISGAPTTVGSGTITVSVSDGRGGLASRSFVLTVSSASAAAAVTYVRLEAVSEINGKPWTSMAEFNLLDTSGAVIPRTGWTVTADSAETVGEYAPAASAIDGNVNSFWHTQWQGAAPAPPHTFTVNLGTARTIGGFRYLPRPGGDGGTGGFGSIAGWRFYTSTNGTSWTLVGQGTFSAAYAEKTVTLP